MKKSYWVIGVVVLFVFGMLGGYLYAVRDRTDKDLAMEKSVVVMDENQDQTLISNVKVDSTSGVYKSSGGNELFIESMLNVLILTVNNVEYRGPWGWTEEGAITAMFDMQDGVKIEPVTVVFDKTAMGELTMTNPEALGVEMTDLKFVMEK